MNSYLNKKYFFCGVGGSGMSALAKALVFLGAKVTGSDRAFDNGANLDIRDTLVESGIKITPQDGSGLNNKTTLVVSSAVEPSIPDVKSALNLNCPILKRAELLAELFNSSRGIAVAGTSGKSTVTAMLMHLFKNSDYDLLGINGAVLSNYQSNFIGGNGNPMVIEADESDGSLVLYKPEIGIINNISEDHKPLTELREIFKTFAGNCKTLVANLDCPETAALLGELNHPNLITYSIRDKSADICAEVVENSFDNLELKIDDTALTLTAGGLHNAENATAAFCTAKSFGVSMENIASGFASFRGVHRRMEFIGRTASNITVLDDFGHNPEKIAASLKMLKLTERPLKVMFQPHGFAPTKLMKDALIATFQELLSEQDFLLMPEIYYAGGTVNRDISSKEIIDKISSVGKNALFVPQRVDILPWFAQNAASNDIFVIMGARDPSLHSFACELFSRLSSGEIQP